MQMVKRKLKDDVHAKGLETNKTANNINDIILRIVIVRFLPKNTGIVSCPINLSLCISKISDMAERMKTMPKEKINATIKPVLKE